MIKVKKEGILLEPTEHKFENFGVLNPASIEAEGNLHLFYRATSIGNYSTIGYCSLDTPSVISQRSEMPLLIPQEKYESQGMEDPRIVKIEDMYFMTYTAYDGSNALGALAVSKDLKKFDRLGIITPQLTYKDFQHSIECGSTPPEKIEKYLRFVKLFYERGGYETVHKLFIWDKDVVFFPKKINGKYAFLHRIYPDIQVVYFHNIKELSNGFWRNYLFNIKDYTVLEGKLPFESSYIGGGCPPVETEYGWLIIYHGVEDSITGYIYHACAVLVELDDPTREIGRLKYPLFSPELKWEKEGVVNNVVFPTGTVIKDGILYIYYGAADKYIGVASTNLSELIHEIKNS